MGLVNFFAANAISLKIKVKNNNSTEVIASIPLSENITKATRKKMAPEIFIEKSDITKVKAQAIVNAANSDLLGGGGVCGAIFDAAGWNDLQNACKAIGSCSVGNACITQSYKLHSKGIKYIIHAVGPDCRISDQNAHKDKLIYSTYTNSLIVADKNNIHSVAFPFISSAIFVHFQKKKHALLR